MKKKKGIRTSEIIRGEPSKERNYGDIEKMQKNTTPDGLALPGHENKEYSIRFDDDIDKYEAGELVEGYVFQLGKPDEILKRTGFPAGDGIELSLSQLKKKTAKHSFSAFDIKGLVDDLASPLAVFAYGEKNMAQNVIINKNKDGKNYLVGINFGREERGIKVSDIRNIFPKENQEWLNWLLQNKGLYVNKNKLLALITQQQINLAEVGYLDLESIVKIIEENFDVNGFIKDDQAVFPKIRTPHDNDGSSSPNPSILFQTVLPPNINEEIDSISEKNIGEANSTIVFSKETPAVFLELGFNNLSVEMYKDKMARAFFLERSKKHGHKDGIDNNIIKRVAGRLADPIAVFKSATVENSLVALYDINDLKGDMVMISLEPDKKVNFHVINLITSAYGRDNKNDFVRWISDGLLLYYDNEEIGKLTVRLDLPSDASLSGNKVLTKSELVNVFVQGEEDRQKAKDDERVSGESHRDTYEDALFQAEVPDSFEEQIDGISEKGIGVKDKTVIFSNNTPVVFTSLGLENLSIEMCVDKLINVMLPDDESRAISKEIVKGICNELGNPLAVFNSTSGKGRLVALYDFSDLKGDSIIVCIFPVPNKSNALEINLLPSIYENENKSIFKNWIDNGLLRYVDDTREKSLAFRLQLPSTKTLYTQTVLMKSELVNRIAMKADRQVDAITALSEKFRERFAVPGNKQFATESEELAIKEIVHNYPKHTVADGIQMLDGLHEDNHDMPMRKKWLAAKLMRELIGEDLILLPRYMDRILNRIAGYQRFNNYSFADSISTVADGGRTFKFKYISSIDKVIRNLNKATTKADVAVVIVSSKDSLERLDVSRFNGTGEAYIINIYNPDDIEVLIKNNTSTKEWRLGHQDTKSQHKLENSSYVESVTSELRLVNPEDQSHMDFAIYSASSDSGNDVNQDEAGKRTGGDNFTKTELLLSEKYRERFIESDNKRTASQDEEKAIKEIVYLYPKHEVGEDVEMLDGLINDKRDMPMRKEYLTARLMAELFGEKLILLPRFMDRMLNRIAGFYRFCSYSLADGISALNDNQKTYEFKFVGSEKKGAKRLKTACAKADIGVVVFSSPNGFDRFDVSGISPESEAYIINVYGGDVTVKYKKASSEWRVHPDSKSRLKPEVSSSIRSIASELLLVNPEEQTPMDYAIYSASNDRKNDVNDVNQDEAGSQKTIEHEALSETRLNKTGDEEWTEAAKKYEEVYQGYKDTDNTAVQEKKNTVEWKNRRESDSIFTQEDFSVAIDLTEELALTKSGEITAEDVKNYINGLIGQVFDTATEPLQIQLTRQNKKHIVCSNVKLNKNRQAKHNSALLEIDRIINNAIFDSEKDVDTTHNTSKKTLYHKREEVLRYVYFHTPITINGDLYCVNLVTERIKNQDSNILDLYNVRVKRWSDANAHLSTSRLAPTENITVGTDSVNSFTKAELLLSEKYRESFATPGNKYYATEDEEKVIKEIVYNYPKHTVADGIQMLNGLLEDNHDMPMRKEYLTARLMRELIGEDLILLPRYIDRMLNRIAGYQRFNNYSLSDGISAVAENGRTFEFKYISSTDKVVRNINKAIRKADVAVVIVSSPASIERVDASRVISKGEAYIINIYDENNVEVRHKNTSTKEWRLGHQEPESQHRQDKSSHIKSIASELRKVNPEDQPPMDYSVYSASSDRGNNVNQDEEGSQKPIGQEALSVTELNQIGHAEWTDTVKKYEGGDGEFYQGNKDTDNTAGQEKKLPPPNSPIEEQCGAVRRKYYGTDKWMKAPNGKASNLTEREWLHVRAENFKKWFGDWEKKSRIEKLLNSETLVHQWDTKTPAYNLDPTSAEKFFQDKYQGKSFKNEDTGEEYVLSKRGRHKLFSHGRHNEAHLKSLFFLPQIIKNSTFITETDSYKENGKYDRYRYFVCGIKMDGVDFTVKSVVGLDSNGIWVYDQGLSQIKKEDLIGMLTKHVTQVSLQLKDNTLLLILQDDYSKVLDEKGEPLVVQGSQISWDVFDIKEEQNKDVGWECFSHLEEEVASFVDDNYDREFYLNIRSLAHYGYTYDVLESNKTKQNAGAITREALIAEGYDGVILREEGKNDKYIVLGLNQIKCVPGTNEHFKINIRTKKADEQKYRAIFGDKVWSIVKKFIKHLMAYSASEISEECRKNVQHPQHTPVLNKIIFPVLLIVKPEGKAIIHSIYRTRNDIEHSFKQDGKERSKEREEAPDGDSTMNEPEDSASVSVVNKNSKEIIPNEMRKGESDAASSSGCCDFYCPSEETTTDAERTGVSGLKSI